MTIAAAVSGVAVTEAAKLAAAVRTESNKELIVSLLCGKVNKYKAISVGSRRYWRLDVGILEAKEIEHTVDTDR